MFQSTVLQPTIYIDSKKSNHKNTENANIHEVLHIQNPA